MNNIITELYVEVYFYLYRIFRNENIAAAIDLLLLVIFQLLNVYSIIVIIQRFLTVDFTGYLFHQPLLIVFLCGVVTLLNFFAGKRAKKALKKEDSERFISKRFTSYVILSIIVFVISRYIPK